MLLINGLWSVLLEAIVDEKRHWERDKRPEIQNRKVIKLMTTPFIFLLLLMEATELTIINMHNS